VHPPSPGHWNSLRRGSNKHTRFVSAISTSHINIRTFQTPEFFPETSSTLKSNNRDGGGRAWLDEIKDSAALLSGILSVVHPELYKVGSEALVRLGQGGDEVGIDPDRLAILPAWPTVFSGMSVISCRETPAHRDVQSRVQWYDILATLGRGTDAVMEFPGLNMRLQYHGGTVMAFGGRIVCHRVPRCQSERICIAMYMRDSVHHRLHLGAPSWMTVEHYE
jgi:hypothetical protein